MAVGNSLTSIYIIMFLFLLGAVIVCGVVAAIVLILVFTLRKHGITRSNIRGNVGEWQVANILKQLNPEQFVVLNDIMFEKQQTAANEIATTQIDHIVVSIYGIFVIETKNYAGKIYGTEKSQKWQYYSHGNKYEFYNPLKQNYKHTKTLQDLLMRNAQAIGIMGADFLIYPIIAFSGNAEIRVKVTGADVVYFGNVPDAIHSHCTQPVLTRQQVDSIVNCILNYNVNSDEKKQEHIQNIRQMKM